MFAVLASPLEDLVNPKQTYRVAAKPVSVSDSFPWNIAVEISTIHSYNHMTLAM